MVPGTQSLAGSATESIRDEDFLAGLTPVDTPSPPDAPGAPERAGLYVPRILQQQLADDPDVRWWMAEGTAALVDISGFTKLSERLSRKGREGAEQITDAISGCFESILLVAYDNGGSLLKFGGDALLLWFSGDHHAGRACRAAVQMRKVLRKVGRIDVPGAKVTLRMSQGVHSGRFHFFAVGDSHLELLVVGPAWSRLVETEHEAGASEIYVSVDTAALLPAHCTGDVPGPARILLREPRDYTQKMALAARPKLPADLLARGLSTAVRRHVLEGGGTSEHRPVTIAFIRFEGTDAVIEREGAAAGTQALQQLVGVVQAAAERADVSFLASDIDADGGKLILTAGAPRVTGDDEERMLLALREIITADLKLSIRIGVNRGAVFAGDIGPAYRRTYTVMGDAVNLAARLMAKATPGHIYATADVLDHSNTLFATEALPPFQVKGKAQPILAWSVGGAIGSRARQGVLQQLPLIGRDSELAALRTVITGARSGVGALVEIVGEAGVGKTRLLEAMREDADGLQQLHAVCEAYTAHTPYAVWVELLRELMGFGRDDSEATIAEHLRDSVRNKAPDLLPWLPLVAIAFDVDVEPTPEVSMLAERNRRARLHDAVGQFLAAMLPGPALIEIENAHHMDSASAELLLSLAGDLSARPWVFGIARRPGDTGFVASESIAATRIQLATLAAADARRLVQAAADEHPLPMHVLDTVAQRSGGNPQFLRDLLRAAIESGGVGGLPDSAEAAAMARIDALAPQDRALVRRASVFGMTFHPRMLSWVAEEGDEALPGPTAWDRLRELFDEEDDGYLRFRRSLLRDAAYEGLPYRVRRQLHRSVAARLEQEVEDPEEMAGILSLHYHVAGAYADAWRCATSAGKRAHGTYAYVEAAGLYARALDAGRRLADVSEKELAGVHEALGDSLNLASEFEKASDAYTAARRLTADDPLVSSSLLLKRSRLEEKLGKYSQALRWAARARRAVGDLTGREAARQAAQSSSWYATLLQAEGRSADAVRWARRAAAEAEAADDPDSLGSAYFTMGWAYVQLGHEDWEPLVMQALEASRRSGDRVKQAAILQNVGALFQGHGRWDEAMDYYQRGRDECIKIGHTVDAAVASMNIAEILSDRGDPAEAERMLRDTLPLWKASKYRYLLGACLGLLGRAVLRAGRTDEALARLEEAKACFRHVGADQDILDVDARIAECRLVAGDADGALALADETLARARNGHGVATVVPVLERVRGCALFRTGDAAGARKALQASLDAARTRRDLFEILLTLRSQIELDRLEGVEADGAAADESCALFERLNLRSAPPVQLVAA